MLVHRALKLAGLHQLFLTFLFCLLALLLGLLLLFGLGGLLTLVGIGFNLLLASFKKFPTSFG